MVVANPMLFSPMGFFLRVATTAVALCMVAFGWHVHSPNTIIAWIAWIAAIIGAQLNTWPSGPSLWARFKLKLQVKRQPDPATI
jgi:hypothetical protein